MSDTFREVVLHITHDKVEQLKDWQEVAAVRIVDLGDGTCRLELTDDLDRITAPETL